jgi:hypothetical protein
MARCTSWTSTPPRSASRSDIEAAPQISKSWSPFAAVIFTNLASVSREAVLESQFLVDRRMVGIGGCLTQSGIREKKATKMLVIFVFTLGVSAFPQIYPNFNSLSPAQKIYENSSLVAARVALSY